jgi:CHAT domain-containing protein
MVLDFFRSTASFSGFDDEGTRRQATELYRVLISPIQGLLDRGQQICIVPDKVLNHLPFSALVSPEGQYLISDYLLSFAPSSNIFLACSEDARLRGGSINERVLSVGNPSFDRAAYPDLKPLPDSETEAEDVARCYQSHTSLVGKNASKSRVLQELGTANVIHLASHYVVDEQDPMRSTLLLADLNPLQTGGRGDGLQASDIYLRKLPMARIVVLSACRTGVEHYYKGEGMIGMSRTFLAARVPLVVASLWPVDSIATTELMVRFHRYRKAGGLTTVTALRKAQLDMINNSQSLYRRPGYWAPFIMIGGHADF